MSLFPNQYQDFTNKWVVVCYCRPQPELETWIVLTGHKSTLHLQSTSVCIPNWRQPDDLKTKSSKVYSKGGHLSWTPLCPCCCSALYLNVLHFAFCWTSVYSLHGNVETVTEGARAKISLTHWWMNRQCWEWRSFPPPLYLFDSSLQRVHS